MHFSNNLKRGAKVALATAELAMRATGAMAAGTDTGVESGFFAIAADISTILSGAGGYLLMIMAVVIGGITLAVSGRWRHDAVAFGVPFIANPDLVARLAADAPLNAAKPELFYASGAEGYTDYPFLDQA